MKYDFVAVIFVSDPSYAGVEPVKVGLLFFLLLMLTFYSMLDFGENKHIAFFSFIGWK